ncbi:uncharacterized protein LOC144378135 [Ictidomys tridecemlineatus]
MSPPSAQCHGSLSPHKAYDLLEIQHQPHLIRRRKTAPQSPLGNVVSGLTSGKRNQREAVKDTPANCHDMKHQTMKEAKRGRILVPGRSPPFPRNDMNIPPLY